MPATDDFFRRLKTVHVVFAVSSIALLLSALWMLQADHSDEWRAWQSTWDRLQVARLNADRLRTVTFQDEQRESGQALLEEERRQAEIEVARLEPLRSTLRKAEADRWLKDRETRGARAFRDKFRADYDLAVRDGRTGELETLFRIYEDQQKLVLGLERELRVLEGNRDLSSQALADVTAQYDKAWTDVESISAELAARDAIEPANPFNRVKRWLMEQPIVDGFNSHHEVKQDWLSDHRITLGMTKTARFDRCRTCHLAIDLAAGNPPQPSYPFGESDSNEPAGWVRAGKYPHPFATHPRPELYVTSTSPHSLVDFGCTSCHEGQGSGTSFSNAAHGHDDPHQHEVWHDTYGYAPNHYWEYPMFPKRLRQAACLKCHHSVAELGVHPKFGPSAPKLYRGWQLIKKFGCFGCHEITGFDGARPIGPDLRLEPRTAAEKAAIDANPDQVAGKMRKVGPSLEHVGQKTSRAWLEAWIKEPRSFRNNTRMPHFFSKAHELYDENNTALKNDPTDDWQPVEIAAIASYLLKNSSNGKLDEPRSGYQPDAENGRRLFSRRGCLACHSHEAFPDPEQKLSATFGPDLTRVASKITANRFNWLYTWVRDPTRHHPRTRMPDLFLDPEGEGADYVDPAADVAAFLLKPRAAEKQYAETIGVADEVTFNADDPLKKGNNLPLNQLVYLYLSKSIGTDAAAKALQEGKLKPDDAALVKSVSDEVELVEEQAEPGTTTAQYAPRDLTKDVKLAYVGRRTISRYGCSGCHEIPGFETARPIGTKLEDWGRKDRTKLAPEHIHEFLHHHGEPEGSEFHNTNERVETAMKKARAGGFAGRMFDSPEQEFREMGAAFYYQSLLQHGREGFLWQKLRNPRSYDYEKLDTKGYDERLRMPTFSFDVDPEKNEDAIEAIATFILGLVAEPPPTKYVYSPGPRERDRIEGERLLEKYNCLGCHMVELPEIAFKGELDNLLYDEQLGQDEHQSGLDLLLKLKPPRQLTFRKHEADGEVDLRFHGLLNRPPNPDDDIDEQIYSYIPWEIVNIRVVEKQSDGNDKVISDRMVRPGTPFTFNPTKLDTLNTRPARGGRFAEWLVESLIETPGTLGTGDRNRSWQMAPPPLYREGTKVQTSWLYRFLKDPGRVRRVTVLRMPRFNMDDDEARALANYFPAVDGVAYPYQDVLQRNSRYLDQKPDGHLKRGWELLTLTGQNAACIKCHHVGGHAVTGGGDPTKTIRGPNLDLAHRRLRPDWTELWLYKPAWITPYTSMQVAFPRASNPYQSHFGGLGQDQVTGVRDALMNYDVLLERLLAEQRAAKQNSGGSP